MIYIQINTKENRNKIETKDKKKKGGESESRSIKINNTQRILWFISIIKYQNLHLYYTQLSGVSSSE